MRVVQICLCCSLSLDDYLAVSIFLPEVGKIVFRWFRQNPESTRIAKSWVETLFLLVSFLSWDFLDQFCSIECSAVMEMFSITCGCWAWKVAGVTKELNFYFNFINLSSHSPESDGTRPPGPCHWDTLPAPLPGLSSLTEIYLQQAKIILFSSSLVLSGTLPGVADAAGAGTMLWEPWVN